MLGSGKRNVEICSESIPSCRIELSETEKKRFLRKVRETLKLMIITKVT